MELDPTSLIDTGALAGLITALVWFIRTLQTRADAFARTMEDTNRQLLDLLTRMQVSFGEHTARDDLIQEMILARIETLQSTLQAIVARRCPSDDPGGPETT